ncbi:MAG: hypothetical protein ACK5QX_07505, partial [bacterium]
ASPRSYCLVMDFMARPPPRLRRHVSGRRVADHPVGSLAGGAAQILGQRQLFGLGGLRVPLVLLARQMQRQHHSHLRLIGSRHA